MQRRGFTLIELLVVITIVAVLAVTVILTLNPSQLLRQARDSNRLADLDTLRRAFAIYQSSTSTSASIGSTSTIYLSLADTTSTCANLALPPARGGYAYRCVTTTTLQNADGTGWLPPAFTSLGTVAPLSVLPVDPLNTVSSYYTYVVNANGTYTLSAAAESTKYRGSTATKDGGIDTARFEVGSDDSVFSYASGLIGSWSFEEGSGSTAADSVGGYTGTFVGSPAWVSSSTVCRSGGCLRFPTSGDYLSMGDVNAVENIPALSVSAWMYVPTLVGGEGLLVYKDSAAWALESYNNGILWYMFPQNQIVGTYTMSALHHVAVTYDGATSKVYLDGTLIGSGARSGAVTDGGGGVLRMGAPGYLDEVRIYNRALSVSEVQRLYVGY